MQKCSKTASRGDVPRKVFVTAFLLHIYTRQMVKISINRKHVVKCLEPTETIPCCAFTNIYIYIYLFIYLFVYLFIYLYLHVPAPAQISTFTVSCTMLEFSREMARYVRDFEISGPTQKKAKNKHTVQTGLCHVHPCSMLTFSLL